MRSTVGASMLAALLLGIAGCRDAATSNPVASKQSSDAPAEAKKTPEEEEREVQKNFARLSPEDRKLAEEQRYCPIMGTRLGTDSDRGEARKIILKGEPLFICCHDCEEQAMLQPARTLARVKELKEKNRASSAKSTTQKGK